MSVGRSIATLSSRSAAISPAVSLKPSQYGRSAAYRRLTTYSRSTGVLSKHLASQTYKSNNSFSSPFYSSISPLLITKTQPLTRSFHTSPQRFQKAQPKEDVKEDTKDDVKDPPKEGETEQKSKADQPEGEESKGEKEGEKEEKKDDKPPPPPHGDKTPWQVFTETLRTEFKASKEWNESTKQLASSAHQFTESEGVRKARTVYDATAGKAGTKTAEALKSTASALGSGAAWTWDTKVVQGIRQGVNATGRGIEKATRPVRETKAFKEVKKIVDDGSSSRYGGWTEKEERRKRKAERDAEDISSGRIKEVFEEDPNAGTNVTVHKDAVWQEKWSSFKENSKLMQNIFAMKNTYNESENPLISTARSITDKFAGFFAENETAMVIKKFREMDPNFQIEPFLRDMREYILPEVLDAYVKGDVETLKLWLSAAQFQVYSALMEQYTKAGLKSDGRILDIRHVDILNARLLEPGEIPVFIITCRTQEVHVYKDKKTNKLAAGMEDRVQLVTYAIGVTRLPEEVNNPETRGWRMIELQKAGRDYI